jgi:hypothetical protein
MDIEFPELCRGCIKFTASDCCKNDFFVARETNIVKRMKFDEENMFETAVKCLKHILWLMSLFPGKLVNKHLILYAHTRDEGD